MPSASFDERTGAEVRERLPPPLSDLSRLCIHTETTSPWNLPEAASAYARAGVPAITVWRESVAGHGPAEARRILEDHGLEIVSYVRGGFFAAASSAARRAAVAENVRVIEEAATLGAPLVVLVCGAVPGQPLETSRAQIRQGLEHIVRASRPCIRSMPTAARPSTPSGRPTTWPRRSTHRASASSWTSITSGGTPTSEKRSPAAVGTTGSSPTTSVIGKRQPHTCSSIAA